MNSDFVISDNVGQHAESELRKFYRAAEQSPSQLIITDNLGRIEYANPTFFSVTGYSPDEIIGKTPAILKSGKMPAVFYERLWETISSGQDWRGEFYNRRRDGSLFWEQAAISSIKGNDGAITHYIKVAEDISAKRSTEERQQRRLKLTEAINTANLHFIKTGNISQMAGIILETCMSLTNSPFAMLSEQLPNGNSHLLALSLATVDPISDVPAYREIQYELLRHGHYELKRHPSLFMAPIIENRTIIVNHSHENRWKGCTCPLCAADITTFAGFPLRVGDNLIGMIGLANSEQGYDDSIQLDLEVFSISCALAMSSARSEVDRKTAQDQLRQSQKMEAIGQLAGGIAHDFNNLLTVISGYSTLLCQKLGNNDTARKDVEQIINAGERATALVRQLLAFSRRQILNPRPVNVNTFVASLHKILGRLIGENITLTTNLATDLEQVKADPIQIEQIIMNLVINARDAMERGGTIIIETANKTLDETFVKINRGSATGNYVMISVRDTGMGMSEDVQSRIFEPFFTTKEGYGTGLGLATVYGIVKQSHGYIKVDSEVGLGTEFQIYLPSMEAVADLLLTDDTTVPEAQSSTSGLILVVEDEQTVLDLSAITLRARGFDVLTASGPLDALDIFERYGSKIDLLLTDVMMPNMSGPEMAEIMRASCPDLKIVFMSGYSDEKLEKVKFPEKRLNFIMKPFSPAELAKAVSDCLAGSATTMES